MVVSLQKTIQQLKAEVARYKARAHKAEQQVAKVRGGTYPRPRALLEQERASG